MSLRKKLVIGAVVAFSVFTLAASALADAGDAAVVVGNESLKPDEVVEVLRSSAGGNPMMVGLMLTQATLAERVEMVKQMADAMLFAEGARISGLANREDVALKLKWQRLQLLLEAYLQEISKKWDMSDNAMKRYYSEHKEEFVQAQATHLRHILTSTEKDANNAILDIFRDKDFAKAAEKFSRDTNTAARGGDLDWMEKGVMPEPIDKEIEKAQLNSLVGPVKTELGWHVIEVLDRRPSKQLTFEEAKDGIEQRLQMSYITKELGDLRKKVKVEINEKSLEKLGGIPAAPAPKTPEAATGEKPAKNASK